MNNGVPVRCTEKRLAWQAAICGAMLLFFLCPLSAATLTISPTGPTPGTYDIYNFSGASHDGANAGNGSTFPDGAANDAYTYIAGDRADQGQTFITGSNTNGYSLNAIWVRHVGYTNNAALTYWQMNGGVTITVRITSPALAGGAGFVLDSETYVTTGNEGWGGSFNSNNGDGDWVEITLDKPFYLAPGTAYGFDVTSSTTGAFWEWLGTSNNVYAGGSAYNGSTSGQPDLSLNTLVGDRVFLMSLTTAASPPVPVNSIVAMPFNLTNVTLLPSPFQTNMLLDKAYLLSLNPDSLLYNYRVNVNLSTSNAPPYGGWEAPGSQLCLGHFTGHYLSACSMMYASTGDPQLKARTDYIVAQLANCQAASPAAGYNTGYLAAFPEYYIDDLINETQNSYFAVPWYTIHKVMAGLLDTYQYTGNAQALTVLTNMANWVQFRMNQLTASQIQAMLNYREYGGMNEGLANLYGVTSNATYLQLAADFDKQSLFVPLSDDDDVLDGLHDNTQIPEIIGASREYELTGSSADHEIATFFWNRVANYRSFVIGGSGDDEFFFPTNQFPQNVSPETCETCCTYNVLKLTRHLFEWQPSAAYMDFYERGLYNQILGSQEPLEGMMTYFVSLEPGHFKTYSTPTNSFWCCTGTGVENHSKYGDTIFFHGSNSLYLNLFIPSILNWPDKGITVTQNTIFPQSDISTLTFDCTNGTPLTLYVRYPSWAQSGMSLTINGTPQTITNSPGNYVAINRSWQNNDQVQIQLPMSLRTETLQDTTNTVALFYGPILLAGALGTNGMPATDFASGQLDLVSTAIPDGLVPQVVASIPTLLSNTVPVPDQSLNFQTVGLGEPRDINLMPFYQLQHQRYSVYWSLESETNWLQFADSNAVASARVIDEVNIGDPVSEAAHDLVAVNSTTGNFDGMNWRDADENFSDDGGSFSYVMAVNPNALMSAECTFWGSDTGNREFNILANGTIIGTETLTNDVPGEFFTVDYPIPTAITSGQTNVTIELQSYPSEIAGGLFGLETVTTASPGSFLGVAMNLASKQTLGGAAQSAEVMDNFTSLTNHLITPSLWLVLTSSDTNVVTIGPDNQLIAVGPGQAIITASYMGSTVSQAITVSQPALRIALSGTNAIISWPSNVAGLQSAFDFSHISAWSPFTNSIIYNNGTNTLTIPATNAYRFFRLSQ
ncbi:MAG TPA: beta-L-arabinofuranosidase domain-containing protein [Candidatus Acidoferrales bacterium]|nr:beta-L-arabinofuranosidase domain-containing protein [Candidatus Acidoferrales bacterium]